MNVKNDDALHNWIARGSVPYESRRQSLGGANDRIIVPNVSRQTSANWLA